MSLRKSAALTPARFEANRCNARKSTAPRTARDKSQSRMNSLEMPTSSPTGWGGSRTAPTFADGTVDRRAPAILTPERAAHPLFVETVDMFRRAESKVVARSICKPAFGHLPKKKSPPKICERSLNVIGNTWGDFRLAIILMKIK